MNEYVRDAAAGALAGAATKSLLAPLDRLKLIGIGRRTNESKFSQRNAGRLSLFGSNEWHYESLPRVRCYFAECYIVPNVPFKWLRLFQNRNVSKKGPSNGFRCYHVVVGGATSSRPGSQHGGFYRAVSP